jgi:hypothetical protein
MFSTNSPAALATERGALDRALMVVAEESFFAMVDPVPDVMPVDEGSILAACVVFEGTFSGSLTCRMPRALAHELTGAFTGEEVSSGGGSVNDLAGEFANMVCGRWLSDVAPQRCSGSRSRLSCLWPGPVAPQLESSTVSQSGST